MTADLTTRPRLRRRYLVLGALGLLALLTAGVFVGGLIYRHVANERLLRAAVAEVEADDPLWRINDLEAHRAVIPDVENAAAVIRRVRAMLPRSAPSTFHDRDQLLKSLSPEVRLTDEQYQALIDDLEEVERAIAPALRLAHYPHGRHPIAYEPTGFMTPLPHLDDTNFIHVRVLQTLLLVLVHEGDTTSFLRAFHATLNLGRSIGDEPFLFSQLNRLRYQREAIRSLERLLGHGECADDFLSAVQRELAAEAAYDPWELSLRGERAMLAQSLEAVQKGLLKPSLFRALAVEGPRPRRTAIERFEEWVDDRFGIDVRPALAWLLLGYTRLLDTARRTWPERRASLEDLRDKLDQAPELVRGLFRHLLKVAPILPAAEARCRCAVAAVAAERYRQRHGDWPPSLAALAPDLLPAVPADPFDGQPLRFRRVADGIVIYSLGPDSKDDSGELADDFPPRGGTDIGFRLWDPAHRRQAPPLSTPPADDPPKE
jgi:hypothetical protein